MSLPPPFSPPLSGPGKEPPGEAPIRILVVDDSFFMRQIVSRMLQEQPDFEVVGTARDGCEAVELNRTLAPDVVTLDVEMPKLDGLGALEKMLESRPVAVVMLSAHTGEGMALAVMALERGAVDCVGKPSGSVSLDLRKIQDELVEKVRSAARISPKLIRANPWLAPPTAVPQSPARSSAPRPKPSLVPASFAVSVASSTGGPKALHELMSRMPKDPGACFLFVQHMAMGFTAALARRLNDSSPFPVKEAEEGELLMSGVGYVAPGGKHLVVLRDATGARAGFQDSPPRHGVKPSADYLLAATAEVFGREAIGVVLTGMGRDGAKGLLDMRRKGAHTYAQDESTCVVYGMPRSSVECGAVDEVLPLVDLGDSLRRRLLARGAGA